MEACRGPTVKALLDAADGPLSEPDAAFLLHQAATTIQQLHSIGVLHRDVKPDNFMFYRSDGTSPLVVIDFGLSMLIGNAHSHRSKWTVGSLLYVRPVHRAQQPASQFCKLCSHFQQHQGLPGALPQSAARKHQQPPLYRRRAKRIPRWYPARFAANIVMLLARCTSLLRFGL